MPREGRSLRGWGGVACLWAGEALCPLIILAVAIDAAHRITWVEYTDRDIGIYATIARFWRDGFIPYRDLYDFKPPLTFVALRVGFALWGDALQSFWRVILVLTAAGTLTMYAGLRRAGCYIAAPLAAFGFLTLVVADPARIVSLNTELLAAACGAGAFGCAAAYDRDRCWWWAVAAGVWVGLATLSKQPAILWLLPVAVQLWPWGGEGGRRQQLQVALRRTALVAAGFAAIVGAVVGYFAYYGAARALFAAVVVDGIRYVGNPWDSVMAPARIPILRELTAHEEVWPFVAAVAILVPLTAVRPSRWAAIAWSWLVASYAAETSGASYHYLMFMFPALAISVGITFELAVAGAPTSEPYPTRRVIGGLLIALLVYGGVWRAVYPPETGSSSSGEAHTQSIGQRIREAAKPGDTLFVKDEPYQLYVYAGMPPMTRFIYDDSPAPGAVDIWASALKLRPTFIVISRGTQGRLPSAKDGFEGDLARLVADEYQLWIDDPQCVVYRRADPIGAASKEVDGVGTHA